MSSLDKAIQTLMKRETPVHTMSLADALKQRINDLNQKAMKLNAQIAETRRELAVEVSPFQRGHEVQFNWGQIERTGVVVDVVPFAFEPFYALDVKPRLKSGDFGHTIRVQPDYNHVKKVA